MNSSSLSKLNDAQRKAVHLGIGTPQSKQTAVDLAARVRAMWR